MKKKISLLLAMLLAVLMLSLGAIAEEETVYYYGAVLYDVEAAAKTLDIRTRHDGMNGFWLTVPEDGPVASEYSRKGIRFSLAAPVPEGGFGLDEIVTPATLEMLGVVAGEIVEIGDDYVVSYVYVNGAVIPNAPTIRLAMDENTYTMREYKEGDPVYIIYDEETEIAYEIWNSNG